MDQHLDLGTLWINAAEKAQLTVEVPSGEKWQKKYISFIIEKVLDKYK